MKGREAAQRGCGIARKPCRVSAGTNVAGLPLVAGDACHVPNSAIHGAAFLR